MEERGECLPLGLKSGRVGAYGLSFLSLCVCVKTGLFGFVVLTVFFPTSTHTQTHRRRIGRRRPESKWNKSYHFYSSSLRRTRKIERFEFFVSKELELKVNDIPQGSRNKVFVLG